MKLKTLLPALLLSTACVANNPAGSRLINGDPVPAGQFKEVVSIRTGSSGCTGTVVGKRVVVTAAHCGSNGATTSFTVDGVKYSGKFRRSPIYPGKDHDVAVAVLTTDVPLKPATVGGTATVGKNITLMGYGCTQPGGSGGNDGVLRYGTNVIKGFTGYDVVSGPTKDGAALCFGDSGGPMFDLVSSAGVHLIMAINSKGNIKDTNYNARLDSEESKKFLEDVVASEKVDICGVNLNCNAAPPPPPPPPGGKFTVENEAVKFEVTNKGKHNDEYLRVNAENLARFLLSTPTLQGGLVHPVQPVDPE